jgi:hypothetical protein
MKKVNWKQAERKIDNSIAGGESYWERMNSDPEFLDAIHKLQVKYGLPLPFDTRLNWAKWFDWIGWGEKPTSQRAKQGKAFYNDVNDLLNNFNIPEAWREVFISRIAGTGKYLTLEHDMSPTFTLYPNGKWECIITPETDLTNPFILALIQEQQRVHAGKPPQPIKDKNNPRKLDWRPVYEWHKKYPLFTLKEIATKLGRPYTVVKSKLEELDKQAKDPLLFPFQK